MELAEHYARERDIAPERARVMASDFLALHMMCPPRTGRDFDRWLTRPAADELQVLAQAAPEATQTTEDQMHGNSKADDGQLTLVEYKLKVELVARAPKIELVPRKKEPAPGKWDWLREALIKHAAALKSGDMKIRFQVRATSADRVGSPECAAFHAFLHKPDIAGLFEGYRGWTKIEQRTGTHAWFTIGFDKKDQR